MPEKAVAGGGRGSSSLSSSLSATFDPSTLPLTPPPLPPPLLRPKYRCTSPRLGMDFVISSAVAARANWLLASDVSSEGPIIANQLAADRRSTDVNSGIASHNIGPAMRGGRHHSKWHPRTTSSRRSL